MSETIFESTGSTDSGYDQDTTGSHDADLGRQFSEVLGEDTEAELEAAGLDAELAEFNADLHVGEPFDPPAMHVRRVMFGANMMTDLLEEPTTTRNFSMTRSGGAWGENE